MGTEFKTIACSVTRALILIEVKRVEEVMNNIKYHLQIVETTAFTNKMVESTNGIGQRYIKGATKDCFLSNGWFSSNK